MKAEKNANNLKPTNKEKGKKPVGRKISQILFKKFSQIINEPVKKQESIIDTKDENEELPPRFLYPNDPNIPQLYVNHNRLTNELSKQEMVSQLAVHFEYEGCTILKESDEYKQQEDIQQERKKQIRQVIETHLKPKNDFMSYQNENENQNEIKEARKILRNKFNYQEVSIQSRIKVIRERGVSTQKPLLKNFRMEVNQSMIFEAYMDYCKKNNLEKLQELGIEKKKIENNKKNSDQDEIDFEENNNKENLNNKSSFNQCLKIMERMIVQNKEASKYQEFRYKFTQEKPELQKPTDSNLHSLWRINYSENKKYNVTSMTWNKRYSDMFAVSFGSYEFGKKFIKNVIAIFSLKNISFPERVIQLENAAISLDFHPTASAQLVVGLDNGNVAVYDIRNTNDQPIYESSVKSKKHNDPVWQVKWSDDSQKLNFYSISSDGRVLNWILMKDILECEEIYKLKLVDKKSKNKENDCSLTSYGSGLCFDFSPFDKFSFIVGTEEGNIHLCCTAYSGDYQQTYEGHSLAVYKVRFNEYDSEIFISASADWSVKIWNTKIKQALLTFELGQSLVDVVWCPFNSTVFIASSLSKLFTFIFD